MHKKLFFEFLNFLKKYLILCHSIRIPILSIVKKKLLLNILISYGDIKGDTGLMGHTV